MLKTKESIVEKKVFDMTAKDVSRQKCREEGHQFQAEGTAGQAMPRGVSRDVSLSGPVGMMVTQWCNSAVKVGQ